MKRLLTVAGIALLVAMVGIGGASLVASAQDDTSADGPFDFAARFKEALAGILGISVDEYDSAVDQAQQQVVDEAVADGWLTDEQAELMRWRMEQQAEKGFDGPGLMGGRGMGGRGLAGRLDRDELLSIAADKLGLSLTELLTELKDGQSIADLAKEQGVDTQVIVDAVMVEVKQDLDEAVADGDMTQNQADYQYEQIQERITDRLDDTHAGMEPGGRPGRGMRGGPGL